LIGLMAGSLRIVWPWPDGVQGAGLGTPNSDVLMALLAAVVGFGVVLAVAQLAPDEY
jgi:putative membrane protein